MFFGRLRDSEILHIFVCLFETLKEQILTCLPKSVFRLRNFRFEDISVPHSKI